MAFLNESILMSMRKKILISLFLLCLSATLPKVEHWKEKVALLNVQTGTLIPAPKGTGATYFLLDQTQTPKFVIKPIDERARNTHSAQAEALSYAIANLLHLGHLTPETHLGIITHDNREKLCSIQIYLPNLENLRDLAENWLSQNISDDELAKLIDQSDFEDLFLLILLFYDTDAHANNIYARKDQSGIYHLIKFDNGLTFPDKNRRLFNSLYLLPNAKRKFSAPALERIQTLPMEKLIEQFIHFEMEDALSAFLQRVEILKKISKDYSMREIDIHFRKIASTSSSVI